MENDKEKSFKCEICYSHFKQKCSLKSHISSVHLGDRPFKCEICDYRSSQKGDMKKHIARVHEGKKPFKCSFKSDQKF